MRTTREICSKVVIFIGISGALPLFNFIFPTRRTREHCPTATAAPNIRNLAPRRGFALHHGGDKRYTIAASLGII